MQTIENKFKSLSEFGINTPIVRSVWETKKIRTYSRSKIPIGIDEDGSIIEIDFSKSKRVLITGNSGSGKSFLCRGIIDRFFRSGNDCMVLTDVKPEYYFLAKPGQEKHKKWHLKFEKPQGLPVKSYYPEYLKQITHQDFPDQIPFQLSLEQLNVYDILTILDMKNKNHIQIIMEAYKIFKHEQNKTLDNLLSIISDLEGIDKRTKRVIKRNLIQTKDNGLIGEKYSNFDFVSDILNQQVPILNLYGYNVLGTFTNYVSALIAGTLRQVLQAKLSGRIDKSHRLLILIDELARFCPAKDNSSIRTSRREIMEGVDQYRQYGISMLLSTQYLDKIPPSVFTQSNVVLMPYLVDINVAKEVFKRKKPERYDYPITFQKEISEVIGGMQHYKNGQRDCLLVSDNQDDEIIFKPLAPLSYHPSVV